MKESLNKKLIIGLLIIVLFISGVSYTISTLHTKQDAGKAEYNLIIQSWLEENIQHN